MSIDVATMKTHLEAARTALETADYAAAEVECLQAQACLAGLPDGSDSDGAEISYARETVNELLKNIRSVKSSAAVTEASSSGRGFLQRTRWNRANPTT